MKNILNYLEDYFDENVDEQLTNRKFKRNKINVQKKKNSKYSKCNKSFNEEE